MPSESTLGGIAFACAIFLLFGMLSDRTTIVHRKGGTSTDAGGYNAAATFSGLVAVPTLAVAIWGRWRAVRVLAGMLARAAFRLTISASGIYTLARLQGHISLYGTGDAIVAGAKEILHSAKGPPVFATVALIGAVATIAMAFGRMRETDGARSACGIVLGRFAEWEPGRLAALTPIPQHLPPPASRPERPMRNAAAFPAVARTPRRAHPLGGATGNRMRVRIVKAREEPEARRAVHTSDVSPNTPAPEWQVGSRPRSR